MKRIAFLVLALAISAMPAFAQRKTTNLSTHGAACGSPPVESTGYGFVQVNTANGGATFTLGGTWSGTISFFGSGDGATTWVALSVTPSNSATTVTTATGNGTWQVNTAGYTHLCAAFTTATSGLVVATIQLSQASARSGGGGGGGGVSGLTAGYLPEAATATTLQNSPCDDGVTTASTVTCSEALASSVSVSSTSDGTHAGSIQLIGNTTAPTLLANSFGWLGPNSASFTKWFIQPPAVGPAAACLPHLAALASSISAMTCGTQYVKWQACGSRGLGDGFNAIPADTYLQTACVNDTGVTVTITNIHCFTDNAGTSTLDVQNNAGTSFLMSVITCNATKASGGAAGTLGSTVTLASGDSANFIFVADGTSKQSNWTVTGTF